LKYSTKKRFCQQIFLGKLSYNHQYSHHFNAFTTLTPNYLAIFVSGIVLYGVGAIYYTVFSKQWMKALGKTEHGMKHWANATPFIVTFFASFLISGVMSTLVATLSDKSFVTGGLFGAKIWLGFIFTALLFNYSYADRKKSLLFIDMTYWLISFIVVAGILNIWR
jgi:hypothetical protein